MGQAYVWPNIECWLGKCSFVIYQGIRNSIAKKPYILGIFEGGGGGPDPLSPTLQVYYIVKLERKLGIDPYPNSAIK